VNTDTPRSESPDGSAAVPPAPGGPVEPGGPAVPDGPVAPGDPVPPEVSPWAGPNAMPGVGPGPEPGMPAPGGGSGQVPQGEVGTPWTVPPPVVEPPEPLGARIGAAAVLAAVLAGLGFPLGWLWSSVAPWLPVEIMGGVGYYADPDGEQRAGAEGWFIVLSLGLGVVLGVATWFALRRYRGSITLLGLAVGSVLTGWLAYRFGHNIGRGHAYALARHAKDGTIIQFPPELRIKSPGDVARWHGFVPYIGGDVLYVAVAAVVIYVLITALHTSPTLSLRRAPAQPQPVPPSTPPHTLP
jgi:hypothetical protein